MKPIELSNHAGNTDEKSVTQAETIPHHERRNRNHTIRIILAIAAAVALMAGSFAIGAFAITKRAETIYVEDPDIVGIEKEQEQELIKFGDSGISFILPDWWKGKYEAEQDGGHLSVYHVATRELSEYEGVLFAVSFEEIIRPVGYIWPWPAFTITTTENGTYYLGRPSDVQFDDSDPVTRAEYQALYDDIKNIQIVMPTGLLENTINMSSKVFVEYLTDNMQVAESLICDAERSRNIIEIVNRQEYHDLYDYDQQLGKYQTDLRIMYYDQEYFVSTTGKTIYGTNYGAKYAHLSDEDINAILETLGGTAAK